MQNEIYAKTVTPARDSADGETPTRVVLTEEVNGYAIWLQGHEYEGALLYFATSALRSAAIERAVKLGELSELELARRVFVPAPVQRLDE